LIIDAYSRMIMGWRVARHMRTNMMLDAIEMARVRRYRSGGFAPLMWGLPSDLCR
jgi:transposase InsO family protein